MEKIWPEMIKDTSSIGKVPAISEEEMREILSQYPKRKDKIYWIDFRNRLNKFPWKTLEKDNLRLNIDRFYTKAQREEMGKNREKAKNEVIKALRLEAALYR